MSYKILWADQKVKRTFDTLESKMQARLQKTIAGLIANPRPQGCKKLSGKLAGIWRLRIGSFRLLYDIDDPQKYVVLLDLDHRRQIYR